MSDDPIRNALDSRSDRGRERGADQVWGDAAAEPSYVAPTPPTPARWPLVAGAAAAALLLVGGIVGVSALTSDSDDSAITFRSEGNPEGPGACVLEVDSGSRLTLQQWVQVVLYVESIRSAEPVDVQNGTFALAGIVGPPITFGTGTRGVYFESESVGDVAHLADEPGVVDLTCLLTPDWAWVPDDPPPGTEVLLVTFDATDAEALHERVGDLLELGDVRAADAHAGVAESPAVHHIMRVLVDQAKVSEATTELEATPGVYQVVREVETDQ